MRRILTSIAVSALIACGSADEPTTPAPAPQGETATETEAAAPAATVQPPTSDAAAKTGTREEMWTWAGEGEPGDLAEGYRICEEAVAKDPKGGPQSPALVRLQLSVACMAEQGWTPRPAGWTAPKAK